MAGGPGACLCKSVQPLFDIMGQRAVHCGARRVAGQAAKICNNMILGATMIATCEAFALADRLGLDRQSMCRRGQSTSSGQSWSMNAYCPAPGIGPNSAPPTTPTHPGFSASPDAQGPAPKSQQAAEATVDADTPRWAHAPRTALRRLRGTARHGRHGFLGHAPPP